MIDEHGKKSEKSREREREREGDGQRGGWNPN